jgi:hypothetical protein
MPARKRSDVEAQIAALQAELDTADTDDEIWVKGDDGREYKVTGRRATSVLKKLGLADILSDDSEEQAGEEETEEEPEDDPQPHNGYFRPGKKK